MEDEALKEELEKSRVNWVKKGLQVDTVELNGKSSHYAIRYPLREGVQSYSLDGKPVSSLMGSHKDYNNGVVGLLTLPNICLDCVSDYAWAMRITPTDATHCIVDITFLVDQHAVEGEDYNVKNLTNFWDITGGQDWELIRNNQKGIESAKYTVGPYSMAEESVADFDEWYINRLKEGIY
jgi:Rieske 2Fe-2S family protein